MTALNDLTNYASFCEIAKPIGWVDKDTDKTILQIKQHNAVGKNLCAWK